MVASTAGSSGSLAWQSSGLSRSALAEVDYRRRRGCPAGPRPTGAEPAVRAAASRSSAPTWSGSGSPSRSPGWPRSPRWSPPAATSGVVHNRLTHTIKVTAVARAIAVRLLRTEDRDLLRDLGGLDHVVVQAAANAHDLGHPPFGHLGERVLDRLARERFGLADGFEGNAQTFRILTELEVHGPGDEGLNLTAAVRAAVLKYPWARFHYPIRIPTDWPTPPRGAGHGSDGRARRSSPPT